MSEPNGFKRIIDIYLNVGGNVSIMFEDEDHNCFILEIEGKISRAGSVNHV